MVSLFTFSFSRTKICFLLSILLIAIVALLPQGGVKNNRLSDLELDKFWLEKTYASPNYDLVMLGDSRLYRGVSPDEISKLTGHKSLNFGYSQAGFSKKYIELALSKLDSSSSRQTAIFAITPLSLTPKALRNQHLNKFLNYDFLKRFLVLHTYSFASKFHRRKISSLLGTTKNSDYLQIINPNGWIASSRKVFSIKRGIDAYQNMFSNNQVSPTAEKILLRKITQLTKNGVLVYGFRPPSSREVENIENEKSGFIEDTFKKRFTTAGGVWLEFDRTKYKSYDGSHLTVESSISFSKDIAHSILELQNNP